MRTAVCLVHVPTLERAALCLVAATHVPVLLATQVLAVLMTQTNVLPHPRYVRMKDYASTLLALTSENPVLFFFLKSEICHHLEDNVKDYYKMFWQQFEFLRGVRSSLPKRNK